MSEKTPEAQDSLNIFTRWADVFEAFPDLISLLDLEGRIVLANQAMKAKFRDRFACLEGVDYREVYCGTPTPEPQPPCAAVLSDGRPVSVVTRLPTLEGWFHVIAVAVPDAKGEIWAALSIVRDVTDMVSDSLDAEQRAESMKLLLRERNRELEKTVEMLRSEVSSRERIEARLVETKSRLWSILKLQPEAFLVVSTDHRIQFASRRPPFCQVFYPVRMHVSRIWGDVISRRVMELLDAARQSHRQCEATIMFVGPAESRHYLELVVQPVLAGAEINELVILCSDVTEIREEQRSLQFEQREQSHVARLCALGEMAANIAHEVNQPLTAVANYTAVARRMLEELVPDDSQFECVFNVLNRIESSNMRAAEIMQSTQRFARKNSNLASADSALLHDVVEGAVRLVSTECRLLDIELDRVGNEQLQINAGAVQVEQVLVNLLLNAIQALESKEDGRRQIRIQVEDTSSHAVVSVVDNGEGLTLPAGQNDPFVPFVTTKLSGTGLGLSVSRRIVEAAGGRIYHAANLGGGTRMTFSIPLAKVMESKSTA